MPVRKKAEPKEDSRGTLIAKSSGSLSGMLDKTRHARECAEDIASRCEFVLKVDKTLKTLSREDAHVMESLRLTTAGFATTMSEMSQETRQTFEKSMKWK